MRKKAEPMVLLPSGSRVEPSTDQMIFCFFIIVCFYELVPNSVNVLMEYLCNKNCLIL